jgi:hypothetical protein
MKKTRGRKSRATVPLRMKKKQGIEKRKYTESRKVNLLVMGKIKNNKKIT